MRLGHIINFWHKVCGIIRKRFFPKEPRWKYNFPQSQEKKQEISPEIQIVLTRRHKKNRRGRLRRKFKNNSRFKQFRDSFKLCYYCSTEMNEIRDHVNQKTIDHVIPVSKGGSHSLMNIVFCCKKCNEDKGNKTKYEFQLTFFKNLI